MCIRDRYATPDETGFNNAYFLVREIPDGLQISTGNIVDTLSLIHISEPTRLLSISYAVFCLKKKKQQINITY